MRVTAFPLLCLALAACTPPDALPPDALYADMADPSPGVDLAAPAGDLASPPDLAPLPDILVVLRGIPGVTAEEKATTLTGYRFFQIQYDQPADHQNPNGQRFKQRVTLLFRSYEAPTVLALSGYYSNTWTRASRAELTAMLSANQVEVEHRFFAPSRPEPPNYDHLTVAQAAADHHRLVAALRPFLSGRWVSTGASKGGMTTVYHRRFYPGDVDASVPYVAPHSTSEADARYIPFVANDGADPACRAQLAAFQRQVLTRRAEVKPRMTALGTKYDRLGIDKALEHCVLELPFGFWQYQTPSRCATIPADGAPIADLYKFLSDVGQITLYGDGGVDYFMPYYYQSARQLGYPAIDEDKLKDLLLHPGTDNPASYVPANLPKGYDPAAMIDVGTWVKTQGRALLFVYGQYDPWTAGAFELGNAQDSYKFIVPQGNHGANLRTLAPADRDQALQILERWMGVKPQAARAALQTLQTSGEALLDPTRSPPESPIARPPL